MNNLADTPLAIATFSNSGQIDLSYKQSPLSWNVISFGQLIPPKTAFKIGHRMLKIMKEYNGAGLAANQCGLNIPIMVVGDKILYRPKLLEVSKSTNFATEGCLSFPGVQVEVERPNWVVMWAIVNEKGKGQTLKFWDKEARCASHEYSHLLGRTILDEKI